MKRKKNKLPKSVNAGGLYCIVANLLGGPYDGCVSLSSHGSVWHEGEHYCHVEFNGDEPNVFRHSISYLNANTKGGREQVASDRLKVESWMNESHKARLNGLPPVPMAVLMPMPCTTIGVHYHMIRSGAELPDAIQPPTGGGEG